MNTSPWNKDRIIGQKRPLQISHIWGIRIRLELEGKTRDLALFNMALIVSFEAVIWSNSKYLMLHMVALFQAEQRCCNRKPQSPVQFEITKGTREAVAALIQLSNLHSKDFLFRSRVGTNQHISTRQYNRIFHGGRKAWSRRFALQHTFHEKNKTLPDLQENQESPGDPTSVGS